MRQSRFTEAQIIGMIKEQEAGMPTAEVCRRHGLSATKLCDRFQWQLGHWGRCLARIKVIRKSRGIRHLG